MTTLYFIMLLLGGIALLGYTANVVVSKVNLLGLGLTLWIAVEVIKAARLLN